VSRDRINIEFAQNALTQKVVYELAKAQGFYPENWTLNDGLVGVHSEVSEANDAFVHGMGNEKIVEELGDTVMRCMGIAEHLGLDIFQAIFEKHIKNHSREFLHGKVRI